MTPDGPEELSVKVAVTLLEATIVTAQVPVPLQPLPDQPVNVDPVSVAAVSVVLVPPLYDTVPVLRFQPIVPELAVIEPLPVPDFVIVRENCDGCCKLAEQVAVVPPFEPVQLHVQGPLPLTDEAVPALQRLLAGALEKVPPLELPHAPLTGVDATPNSAVTFVAVFIVTAQVPVPLHPPLQPVKVEPEAAVAVSVTLAPLLYDAVPVVTFQLIVPELAVTVPLPPPDFVTVRVNCDGCWRLAEQVAVVPPPDPVQLQVQGPLPLRDEAVPALQKLLAGALVNVPPLELPQAPLTGDEPDCPARTGQTECG